MDERRQYTRLLKSLKIVYKIADPPSEVGEGLSEDVGEGGIRFSIEHKLSSGDIVSLEILITTVANPIIATGQVIWVKKIDNAEFPYMVGIKFIKIDPLDRCRLITYFHKLIEEGRLDEMYWLGELDKYKTEKTDESSEEYE